jgi:hypothetical protein
MACCDGAPNNGRRHVLHFMQLGQAVQVRRLLHTRLQPLQSILAHLLTQKATVPIDQCFQAFACLLSLLVNAVGDILVYTCVRHML